MYRVLFVTPLPPPVHGAAMVSQQIQRSRLINEAFECDFINSSISKSVDDINRFKIVKVFRHLGIWFRLLSKLISKRYDLCYLAITCHGKSFLKDVPFVLLCKLFGRKIIIHQHNKGMSKDIDVRPYRWLLPLCYRNAKVILLSWHLYEDISRVVPKENVIICPNGIAIPENRPAIQKEGNRAVRLLFLSNLIESKGVIVLLDALKILMERGRSFRCDFAGGETKEISAGRFAQEVDIRGLNGFAFYNGCLYGEDKERIFYNSDIFVLPTFYENECFPLVLLEAMSHRLPIVTTDEGGIPDMVENGKNGLICRKDDPVSLAECIARLMDDEAMRLEMGDAGYDLFISNFTERHFEHRLTECLDSAISPSKQDSRY